MAEEQQPSFLEKFKMPFSVLWDQYKGFLIVFSVLILIFKFREVIIDILISSAHKTVSDATKQDSKLHGEENAANDQANSLRKEASDMANNKPVINEDWNKKK